MFKKILPFLMLVFTAQAFAGQTLVTGGTITAVGNNYSNIEMFSIKVTGGTGPCAGYWINFLPNDVPTSGIYNRAYANALLAFATGSTVTVYSSSTTSYACDSSYNSGHGTYLELDK